MWNVSAINDFSHNNPTSAAAVVASMVLFTGKDFQSSAFPNYFSKVDWVAHKLQCLYMLDMYICMECILGGTVMLHLAITNKS